MRKLLINILMLAIFASCSDKTPELNESNATAACFQAMDYRYEDLLTKADIAKHITIDENSYKREVSTTKGDYGSCFYTWNSDRPNLETELLGQIISVPDRNRVGIKMLTFYSKSEIELYKQSSALSLFDFSYKKLTQQEYNELVANLEKEYANDPSGFEQAKKILDIRKNFTYQVQENLGDRAYWKWHDEHGIELVVLSGTAHFTIVSKVASTAVPSLEASVKFAKEVLKKCNK